jgi:RNA polymerase sigma-B factor
VTVAAVLEHLPPRERLILRLRFLEDLTQTEIAARIGISQMQVSRLLRRSLEELRDLTQASSGG